MPLQPPFIVAVYDASLRVRFRLKRRQTVLFLDYYSMICVPMNIVLSQDLDSRSLQRLGLLRRGLFISNIQPADDVLLLWSLHIEAEQDGFHDFTSNCVKRA